MILWEFGWLCFVSSSKVKELRDALDERGLDGKGNKAVLKERLLAALIEERSAAAERVATPEEEEQEDEEEDEEEPASEQSNDAAVEHNGPPNGDSAKVNLLTLVLCSRHCHCCAPLIRVV